MKLQINFHSHKYSCIWRSRIFVWFLSNWILSLFSPTFMMRRCGFVIVSVLDQKKNIPTSFVFLLRKSAFPIELAFFCNSSKIVAAFFCGTSAKLTAFHWKFVAVNLNSQQKFYDNGASVVFSRLTVVSEELPAMLGK